MPYCVYILYSEKYDRFYVGITSNITRRLAQHNNKETASTAGGVPWILIWITTKKSLRHAETLENKLKNLTRQRKIKFMLKYNEGLVIPACSKEFCLTKKDHRFQTSRSSDALYIQHGQANRMNLLSTYSKRNQGITLCGLFLILCAACSTSQDQLDTSHELGVITAFAEMVAADVKQLALSSPLTPAQAESLANAVSEIAEEYEVDILREPDLIKTDLFPPNIAEGMEVFLIGKPNTLHAYQTLKSDATALGPDDSLGRLLIARRFGRLLSYSPKKINQLLSEQTSFRTMTDFGLVASNVFLYYKDLEAAEQFYTGVLGLHVLARFDNSVIVKVATASTITLVDAAKGMHSADEPKTVAIALLTNQLKGWYDYLLSRNVAIKYPYKSADGSAHDGFVAIDPEGYLLEFETFKQHPENERFMPVLETSKEHQCKIPQRDLGFHGSIVWTYHKDLLDMEDFYQNVMGLELVADQGWTKIYQVSRSGFLGLVDERRGMHSFTADKGVTLSFILEDLEGWHTYATEHEPFELRSDGISTGPEERYREFVAYGPEGYFLEFDKFYEHPDNDSLIRFLTEN